MISALRRLIAVFGAPVAWMTQININQGLAAYACYPHAEPLSAPLWNWLTFALFAVSFAAFLAAGFSGCLGWILWRRARHATQARPRFIARMSLVSSGIFLTAIVFSAVNLFMVSPCRTWL